MPSSLEAGPSSLACCCGHVRISSSPEASPSCTTIDASQALPIEARCDVVIVVRSPDGIARAAVIVEIQYQADRDKRLIWPLYLTALRARLACPVVLLVIAPLPAVARWARRAIPLGHPGLSLRPIVISYDDLPRITEAGADVIPQLVVLSARAHPDLEVARAASSAIRALPEDQRTLYWNFLITILPDMVARALEADMNPTEIQNAIAEMSFERGQERGRTDALRAVVITLATRKLGPRFDAALQARVQHAPASMLAELVDAMIATDDPRMLVAAIERLG